MCRMAKENAVEFMNECRVFWLKRNMNERGKNAHKSLSGFAGKSVGNGKSNRFTKVDKRFSYRYENLAKHIFRRSSGKQFF